MVILDCGDKCIEYLKIFQDTIYKGHIAFPKLKRKTSKERIEYIAKLQDAIDIIEEINE